MPARSAHMSGLRIVIMIIIIVISMIIMFIIIIIIIMIDANIATPPRENLRMFGVLATQRRRSKQTAVHMYR